MKKLDHVDLGMTSKMGLIRCKVGEEGVRMGLTGSLGHGGDGGRVSSASGMFEEVTDEVIEGATPAA